MFRSQALSQVELELVGPVAPLAVVAPAEARVGQITLLGRLLWAEAVTAARLGKWGITATLLPRGGIGSSSGEKG